MRRLGLFLWLCCLPLAAQTTTITGTVRDLTQTTVTSGRITFTLRQGVGVANIAGTGAFVSNTVSCLISQSGNPVSSVDGVSPCTITSNTSLTPTGTYYQMCIQPQFVTPGSCINTTLVGGSVDISTVVPTPATQPNYPPPSGPASLSFAGTDPNGRFQAAPYTPVNKAGDNGLGAQSGVAFNLRYFADAQTGSDCGAKINAALSTIGSSGTVELSPACGTITTAVTLAGQQHLHFLPGTYTLNALITLSGSGSSIEGSPQGDSPNGTNGAVYIAEGAGANLAAMISVTGTSDVITDVTLDGNKSGNPSGGAVLTNTGLRTNLRNISIQNAKGDGIINGSNSTAPSGQALSLDHVMVIGNAGHGLHSYNSNDVTIYGDSQFENNGKRGIDLCNTGGTRIAHSDFGGNTAGGILVEGTKVGATTVNANGCGGSYANHQSAGVDQIIDNQFGANLGPDIELDGWDSVNSAYTAEEETIASNKFLGNASSAATTALLLVNSAKNVIASNYCADQFGTNSYTYCLDNSQSLEQHDVVSGNLFRCLTCTQTAYGSVNLNVTQTDYHSSSFNGTTDIAASTSSWYGNGLSGGGTFAAPGWSIDSSGNEAALKSCWGGSAGFCASINSGSPIVNFDSNTGISENTTTHQMFFTCGGTGCGNVAAAGWNLQQLSVGGGAQVTSTNALPQVGTPTAGHASCIKSAGPPVVIGYCSTQPDASGNCTCN